MKKGRTGCIVAMKRLFLVLLALLLLGSCCFDEGIRETARNEEKIEAVFAMLTPIADDLCSAWELVKSDESDITVEKLSEKVNLSADELTEGIIYVYAALSGAAQETVAEAQRTYLKKQINTCLALQSSELVWIVSSSYKKAGIFDPIEVYLKETEDSVENMNAPNERMRERLADCRELFQLCSQPSDNYEHDIVRIRELLGLQIA